MMGRGKREENEKGQWRNDGRVVGRKWKRD